MPKGKTFFIVPGFKEQAIGKQYRWLRTLLEKKGFLVVTVPIEWDRRTMDEYSTDFIHTYEKYKTKTNYVLGFSFGAVITFLTAATLKPDKIFLCSLSPDFKEDVSAMKPWIRKYVGKRRIAHSLKTGGRMIAKNLKVPSVVFCGEAEGSIYPQLMIRCRETATLAAKSKLVIVERAPHKIDFPSYQAAISKELRNL